MLSIFPGKRIPNLESKVTNAPLVSNGIMTSMKTFNGFRRM